MDEKRYSSERNVQILIYLMKQFNVKKIVISPGTTNMCFVGSVQNDPFFEIYSCVDERGAAYLACGLASESGEAVALSCTGATASRNYYPGLTEAYYRKLPLLAITSSQDNRKIGHLYEQITDRRVQANDVVNYSTQIQNITDEVDEWDVNVKINNALLALTHHGGGPVHINLMTTYSQDFSVVDLPSTRVIRRYMLWDCLPELPSHKKIAIFMGSNVHFEGKRKEALEKFCEANNAVIFGDATCGYNGKYFIPSGILAEQSGIDHNLLCPDIMVRLGEISSTYLYGKEEWRVCEDGKIRDAGHTLTSVFEMRDIDFFERYSKDYKKNDTYLSECQTVLNKILGAIPEIPFSNIWIAQQYHDKLPENSVLYLGIKNSLRSWSMFKLSETVNSYGNVGGFGTDGMNSSMLGAALASPDKITFGVCGDLAFFYDMNALGNRDMPPNFRLLIINNGEGFEMHSYKIMCHCLGEDVTNYLTAEGHFAKKSPDLVKHFAEDLGFEYMSASNKDEFHKNAERFFGEEKMEKAMIYEVFTNSCDEDMAMYAVNHVLTSKLAEGKKSIASLVKKGLPTNAYEKLRDIYHRF